MTIVDLGGGGGGEGDTTIVLIYQRGRAECPPNSRGTCG